MSKETLAILIEKLPPVYLFTIIMFGLSGIFGVVVFMLIRFASIKITSNSLELENKERS